MQQETIDRKFEFKAINPCNKKTYTQENAMVFVAKDKALPATLAAYQKECIRLGCANDHLDSIGLLMVRVAKFQDENKGICKVPDTHTDCEIDRCIGGKIGDTTGTEKKLPEPLLPVLAEISGQKSLGPVTYPEVVYHNGIEWCSYSESSTFKEGETVTKWVYAADALAPF